jgi:sulfide:quinone oxidoreductase
VPRVDPRHLLDDGEASSLGSRASKNGGHTDPFVPVIVPHVRILILGGGFGGLELTASLSDEHGDEVEIVLIDQSDGFVFGFSKLDVMFGRALPAEVRHSYASIVKPGVQFVQTTVRAIDPMQKRVETDDGTYEADVLVIALGADLHPEATPGLLDGGFEFYTVPGAFALRDVLADFKGGQVIVAVTSTPFKCPPAPSETALLMHDFLSERGLRESSEIALLMPLPVPIPPSPAASEALLTAFAERGISWHPQKLVKGLDASRNVALLDGGDEMPYDLFLGVPVHRVPAVVEASGMTVDGWIPVDPRTLETSYPGVYAVGDVTSAGTPKAGVFAEGQASVVAQQITSIVKGGDASQYGGRGVCYLEFGHEQVARVDVTFLSGQAPTGGFDAPSEAIAADKVEFGKSRIQRWFGREWRSAGSAHVPT